jgi:hypothetical protein
MFGDKLHRQVGASEQDEQGSKSGQAQQPLDDRDSTNRLRAIEPAAARSERKQDLKQ